MSESMYPRIPRDPDAPPHYCAIQCPNCGIFVPTGGITHARFDEHVCKPENLAAHVVSEFDPDREFGNFLDTPEGRFALHLAKKHRLGEQP